VRVREQAGRFAELVLSGQAEAARSWNTYGQEILSPVSVMSPGDSYPCRRPSLSARLAHTPTVCCSTREDLSRLFSFQDSGALQQTGPVDAHEQRACRRCHGIGGQSRQAWHTRHGIWAFKATHRDATHSARRIQGAYAGQKRVGPTVVCIGDRLPFAALAYSAEAD